MNEAQDVDVNEETESEWDTNDDSSDEYLEVKTILSTGGKRYLNENKYIPVDTDDSSDEDWLMTTVHSMTEGNCAAETRKSSCSSKKCTYPFF